MKKYDLDKFLEDSGLVEEKILNYKKQKIIVVVNSSSEIKGHLLKAQHNLEFVNHIIKSDFLDWCITGCYYASYHAALSLIMVKGFSSKNHLATLCILIKEFYKKGLNKEDIEMLSRCLDYQDVLFYVESKNKREKASYSTKTSFDKKEVEKIRLQTIMFVNKVKSILDEC